MNNENLFPFGDMLDNIDGTNQQKSEPINPAAAFAQEEETQQVTNTDENDAINDNGTEKTAEKKERKKPNRPITKEDADFVIANLKKMSYPEMAEACGLTKHQVSRILTETRKTLRDQVLKGTPEQQKKVEDYITAYLTKPDDQRSNSGGEVKAAITEISNSIFKSL